MEKRKEVECGECVWEGLCGQRGAMKPVEPVECRSFIVRQGRGQGGDKDES